jgi:enoyl reductase-like protein
MQYWKQIVEHQEPIDVSINLVLGSFHHSAIEMLFRAKQNGDKIVDLNEMLTIFEHLILEEESRPFINWGKTNRQAEVKKAEGVFKAILEGQVDSEVIAVEEMFNLDLEGLPSILGSVDLIERNSDGHTVLVDFRASATKPSKSSDSNISNDIDASHQMTLYQMWAKGVFLGG